MILDFIKSMRNTSGNLAKADVLKSMPEWTEQVLNYSLNPFFNFNVKTIDNAYIYTINGTNNIGQETFDILDRLRRGEVTGNAAKTLIHNHSATLTANDSLVLEMILTGKLRLGLGIKTLNKYLKNKIPVHETKLASKLDINTVSFPLWASPKLDGMRAEAKFGTMVSRTGKPITGQQHILSHLDDDMPLDGELMIPGLPFEVSLGQLRSHADNPKSVFYVFDTPVPGVKFEERLERIDRLKGRYHGVKILKHKLVHNVEELLAYYQECRRLGLEGVVTKRPGHLFTTGRNQDWQKMKEVSSMDLKIVGFEEGEGKYVGTLGAVVVELPDGQTTNVGTGFSDDDRGIIWENQRTYLGEIMEVQYHEKTLAGNLRHPRYYRMRPDKVGNL
jgi:DNA ligase-1